MKRLITVLALLIGCAKPIVAPPPTVPTPSPNIVQIQPKIQMPQWKTVQQRNWVVSVPIYFGQERALGTARGSLTIVASQDGTKKMVALESMEWTGSLESLLTSEMLNYTTINQVSAPQFMTWMDEDAYRFSFNRTTDNLNGYIWMTVINGRSYVLGCAAVDLDVQELCESVQKSAYVIH
jgi:hypothetical protein